MTYQAIRFSWLILLAWPLSAPGALSHYRKPETAPNLPTQSLVQTLRSLPETNPRIFNLEWDTSSLVLYANPGARVIDILDPSFLYSYDRQLHDSRSSIAEGRMPDVTGFLAASQPSDYLLTKNPALQAIWDFDPTLIRLYPPSDVLPTANEPFLYKPHPKSRTNFVSEYSKALGVNSLTLEQATQLQPGSSKLLALKFKNGVGVFGGPTYLDGNSFFSGEPMKDNPEQQVRCLLVSPSAHELKLAQGRTILGLGGGRFLRAWLNGKPLYNSLEPPQTARLVHQLLPLHRPLRSGDRLEVISCSKTTGPFFGVSVSTWTTAELDSLCQLKGWKPAATWTNSSVWQRIGSLTPSCIGWFAGRP